MVSVTKSTLLSLLGWVLGVIIILVLSGLLDANGIEFLQFYTGLGVSLGISLMQYFVLRKHFLIGINWIWLSTLCFTLPFIVTDTLRFLHLIQTSRYNLALSVVAGAVFISLAQYNLIRHTFKNAKYWIPYNIACWLVAGLMVFAIEFTSMISSSNLILFLLNLFLILSGGPVIGLATALAARKIMVKNQNSSQNSFMA